MSRVNVKSRNSSKRRVVSLIHTFKTVAHTLACIAGLTLNRRPVSVINHRPLDSIVHLLTDLVYMATGAISSFICAISLDLCILMLLVNHIFLCNCLRWRSVSDLYHRSFNHLIHLLADLLHLVLSVQVFLHDLVSLNETIEFMLQLVVLLREESLMAVQ